MLTFHELLARFGPHTRRGKDYRVRCPVHGDTTPSLDIAEGDTGIVFLCRSGGCATRDILAAVGLTWADVLPPRTSNGHGQDIYYDYRDAAGILRYQVVRQTPKTFRQRHPDGHGSWIWKMTGVPRLPYRLPELYGHARVWIPEGEKDVDRLWLLGQPATCNTTGAKKWLDSDSAFLKAAGVQRAILLTDNDDDGRAHVKLVAASLEKLGITSLTLPPFAGLPIKGDVSDWLDLGHTRDELEALVLAQTPVIVVPRLDPAFLADAVHVIQEGQRIAQEGIRYTIEGIVPAYGMLGMLVAFAKVGKTTIGQGMAAAVAMGRPFLDRETTRARVLIIAAEDPPEYTAYLARMMDVEEGWLTFSRAPIQLNADGLERIVGEIKEGGYGLVLIASWQAVVRGLIKDENDNAGAVNVVENVKLATRRAGIPWVIDAHSGKGEDQSDEADPTMAMRGASSAQGAADYSLSLRYANGTFGNRRRFSGKGRFVNFAPLMLDYDIGSGLYTCLGDTNKVQAETTWQLICEIGALTTTPRSAGDIARAIGLVKDGEKPTGGPRRRVADALKDRPTVGRIDTARGGTTTSKYHLIEDGH